MEKVDLEVKLKIARAERNEEETKSLVKENKFPLRLLIRQ